MVFFLANNWVRIRIRRGAYHFPPHVRIAKRHVPLPFQILDFQIPRFPGSDIVAPPGELSDPNIITLPAHPGIEYAASSQEPPLQQSRKEILTFRAWMPEVFAF